MTVQLPVVVSPNVTCCTLRVVRLAETLTPNSEKPLPASVSGSASATRCPASSRVISASDGSGTGVAETVISHGEPGPSQVTCAARWTEPICSAPPTSP